MPWHQPCVDTSHYQCGYTAHKARPTGKANSIATNSYSTPYQEADPPLCKSGIEDITLTALSMITTHFYLHFTITLDCDFSRLLFHIMETDSRHIQRKFTVWC